MDRFDAHANGVAVAPSPASSPPAAAVSSNAAASLAQQPSNNAAAVAALHAHATQANNSNNNQDNSAQQHPNGHAVMNLRGPLPHTAATNTQAQPQQQQQQQQPPPNSSSASTQPSNEQAQAQGQQHTVPASAVAAPASSSVAPSSSPVHHAAPPSSSSSPSFGSGGVSSGADDGTVLFVGDLSRSVKEDELTALFAPYGALTAVDIKRDKLTQHNLGYAFVALASRAEATRAKLALHGFELHGRKLRIGWAQKNTTLFIGDLDGACTTQQLIRAFEPFGHIIHEETFVKQPSGKYGFVRFASREDAERAKNEMNHKLVGTRPIRIGWGDSNFEKHCVHVQFESSAVSVTSGLSVNAVFTESFFAETFTPFASACGTHIVSISLPKHNHTRKLKGFAFVHMTEDEAGERAAVLALQTLTNSFSQAPLAQHLQNPHHRSSDAAAAAAAANGQASFGGQQGSDSSATVQTHLLGGVPVKYSYGKRQIFSRHRRAQEAATGAGANGAMPGALAGQSIGGLPAHMGVGVGVGVGGAPNLHAMHASQLAAATLLASGMGLGGQQQQQGGGSHQHNLNTSQGGGGRDRGGYRGGRHPQQQQQQQQHQQLNSFAHHQHASGLGAQGAANLYSNAAAAAAFLPYMQQLQQSQQQQQHHQVTQQQPLQHGGSRYHTNPQATAAAVSQAQAQAAATSAYLSSQHSPLHGSIAGAGHPQGHATHSPQHSSHDASSWIQNLAAQQYAQGLSPLTVQQVQQAYQQIHQQHQQQQHHQQQSVHALGGGGSFDSFASNGLSSTPPSHHQHHHHHQQPHHRQHSSGDSSGGGLTGNANAVDANSLANAANAFFSAQTQFFTQQQAQSPLSHLQLSLSPGPPGSPIHPLAALSHSSPQQMAQLMADMKSFGLVGSMPPAALQVAPGGVGVSINTNGPSGGAGTGGGGAGGPSGTGSPAHAALITSGHSSAASSPSHASNAHALHNFYAQQQMVQQIKPL